MLQTQVVRDIAIHICIHIFSPENRANYGIVRRDKVQPERDTDGNIGCPLTTDPGISLIILIPMKILQRNLNRSTFVV
jgi:hypothetical protein